MIWMFGRKENELNWIELNIRISLREESWKERVQRLIKCWNIQRWIRKGEEEKVERR